jgi:hypothetical protein
MKFFALLFKLANLNKNVHYKYQAVLIDFFYFPSASNFIEQLQFWL